MAKLFIYNEITDEETKVTFDELNFICYKDISKFLNELPKDDKEINIRINCPGGNCLEGWAIYDALRTSGRELTATIEGECSSMATIILLAAPKERRFAYENAKLLIHNPSVFSEFPIFTDRLTAEEIGKIKAKLTVQQQSLFDEQNRILDLYEERTGADRATLQNLMNEDKFVDMEHAINLGFITSTLPYNTATRANHKPILKAMKTEVKESVLKKLLALAGFGKIEDVEATVLSQKVTAADGTEFTVEREEGDPQVGDKAYPNGTYILEDGTTIAVEDEIITSITTPTEEEQPAEEPAAEEPVEASPSPEEAIATLTAENEALKQQVATLTAANATLESDKATLTDKATSLTDKVTALNDKVTALEAEKATIAQSQKTADEQAILDIVNEAGGMEWLQSLSQMQGTFHAGNRVFIERGGQRREGESRTQQLLREQRERQEAKRKARK